jgi:hypothetical protein
MPRPPASDRHEPAYKSVYVHMSRPLYERLDALRREEQRRTGTRITLGAMLLALVREHEAMQDD